MSITLDICVPTCGASFYDLIMTFSSCQRELENARYDGIDHRYFLFSNGNKTDESKSIVRGVVDYLKSTGHLGRHFDFEHNLNPANARNAAASMGSGEYIFFFDDHCNVFPGYFRESLRTFGTTDAASVRGITWANGIGERKKPDGSSELYWTGKTESFGLYRQLDFDNLLWGDIVKGDSFIDNIVTGAVFDAPYRIANAPHGAFAVRRDVWQGVGGYWKGLLSFTGEDSYLDMKLGAMGYSIYLNPKVQHWHRIGIPKPYDDTRRFGSDTVETMLAVANVIGERKWAERLTESVEREISAKSDLPSSQRIHGLSPGHTRKVLLPFALERSEEHREWLQSKRKWSLEDMLDNFRRNGVAGVPSKAHCNLGLRAA